MDKKIGVIYKFTNKINGKIYIGQTTTSFNQRSKEHYGCKDHMYFHRALRKYGKENFDSVEICSASNIDDLNHLEEYFIKEYDSLIPNGYNVVYGGQNFKRVVYPMQGKTHSEETKRKMSIAHIGKIVGLETREKQAKAKIGRKQSPEHRANSAKARSGKFRKGHAIICDQTGEIFLNACEAASKTGLYRTKIYRQLTGRVKNTKCPLTFSYVEKRT